MLTSIENVIPEKNIIFFSPHFDDVLFCLGGYIGSLRAADKLQSKTFSVELLFSRSNYLARDDAGNRQTDDARLQQASGIRMIEDMNCLDELIGVDQYVYALHGFRECFARGKACADSEMEFPHGMFADFDDQDRELFEQTQSLIQGFLGRENTALVFLTAIKEHIDHFIVREAAVKVASQNPQRTAAIYFAEDKPYGGLANDEELQRYQAFLQTHKLVQHAYAYDPQAMLDLAFKHYVSQVEDCYRDGILKRAQQLKQECAAHDASIGGVDLIHRLPKS